MEQLTKERLEKYINLTNKALNKVKIQKNGRINFEEAAKDFLDMANRYYKDALYFKKNNQEINAFAAINYAHGWLDAGARIGLFDVDNDNVLFTVDPK
ncbi:MAG: DUF357 domain-containing protein [Nanoarchaeota archaeon]